jgi:hypothetical protein
MGPKGRPREPIPSPGLPMIRIETEEGWTLIEHPEHARLAGRFAARWGNAEFAAPEPRADILVAVTRHDDAWADRDRLPFLTRQGRPSAFSQELVGKYSAFEEIDLADYLRVRGRAAEVVAADNPYAAVVISMHTVDLLTTHADLSGLGDADRELHRVFIGGQRHAQAERIRSLSAAPGNGDAVTPARLQRAFEFLQACDSMSLAVCSRFPRPISLRHLHPRRDGTLARVECTPLGNDTYRLSPYPLDDPRVVFDLPCRHVAGREFTSQDAFRAAYAAAPMAHLEITIVR